MIVREVSRTFPLDPPGLLRISTCGAIQILSTPAAKAVVIVARHEVIASDDRAADEILRDLRMEFTPAGGVLTVAMRYQGRRRKGDRVWPPVQTHLTVTAPAASSVELESGGERIEVGDRAGDVHVRSGGGTVRLGRIGGGVTAATSGGNLSLAAAGGPVQLRTDGGRVDAGAVGGSAAVETSGGAIQIAALGQAFHAVTGGGEVRAGCRTLHGESIITAGDGNVYLAVDAEAAFDLDACGTGVTITIPGSDTTAGRELDGRLRIRGRVHGGGPALTIRADTIRLEAAAGR